MCAMVLSSSDPSNTDGDWVIRVWVDLLPDISTDALALQDWLADDIRTNETQPGVLPDLRLSAFRGPPNDDRNHRLHRDRRPRALRSDLEELGVGRPHVDRRDRGSRWRWLGCQGVLLTNSQPYARMAGGERLLSRWTVRSKVLTCRSPVAAHADEPALSDSTV